MMCQDFKLSISFVNSCQRVMKYAVIVFAVQEMKMFNNLCHMPDTADDDE